MQGPGVARREPREFVVPVISRERRQSRYESILRAARRAFAEKSFEAVSIAQIARGAGISDGLVYHYFKDKRDLLDHVLRQFYERLIVDLEAKIAKGHDFESRLYELIRAHLEVFVEDTDLCRLFISEVRIASDYVGSTVQDMNRAYTSILTMIFNQAIADGEVASGIGPRLLRDAIFGAIEHRAWRFVNGRGPLDTEQTARELTDLFVHGLGRKVTH